MTYRLGFDIGGTNIACGLFDGECSLLLEGSVPFPRFADGAPKPAEAVAECLAECMLRLTVEYGVPPSGIERAGICLPGSIDRTMRRVINAHNIGFHDVPFAEIAERSLGTSVFMRNDADAAALAEHRFGALKGASCAVLLTLGTGVGGGIIINGKLFHGGRGNGTEPGHIRLGGGMRCTCGGTGCMETVCSASWLKAEAEELLKAGNKALAEAVKRGPAPDAEMLASCAADGDSGCLAVWNRYIDSLSDAAASIMNLLDPEIIAIGGGVCGAGDFLIEPLARLSAAKCFFDGAAKVVRAELGAGAGLIGSVLDE